MKSLLSLRTFVALLLTLLATATAWAADTEPPTVSNKKIAVVKTDLTSISISWNMATDNEVEQNKLFYAIKYRATSGKDAFYRNVDGLRGISSYTFTSLQPNTEYEITLFVYDYSINTTYYETLYTKTLADNESPTIPNRKVDVLFERTLPDWDYDGQGCLVTLEWEDAKDNISKSSDLSYVVYYKKSSMDTYYQKAVDRDNFNYKKQRMYEKFLDLEPGTYDFIVEVQDEAKNTARYDQVRYKLPASSFNAPTIPDPYLVFKNITDNSVEISWNKAIDDETRQQDLAYRLGYHNFEGLHQEYDYAYDNGITDSNGRMSTTAYQLRPNTWCEFRVDVYDKDKNVSHYDTGRIKTMPRDYENDKEAPTLSNKTLSVTNATDNSLTLNWTKAKDNLFDDEDLSYTVMYREPSSGRYSRDGAEQGRNISSSHISSLNPNTTYEFIVRVEDRVGNRATYDILTYTTSNAQDRTAPTISNKTVTATDVTYGSVALAWNKASDNVTKQENLQYSVYRDGVLCQKMKNETSYIVGDLKPSTKYTFEVRVEDEAGNISKYNTVQATTTAKPTTVTAYPLYIEGIQVTSANANDFWEDGGTISYNPTTKTLTLSWASLSSTRNVIETKDDITINLIGWNTISGYIFATPNCSKITIKADDKNGENAQLKIQNGYIYCYCDLTIKNECTVEIDATSKGNTAGLILNSHQLSVYGSTLKVKGDGKNATITGISALSMTDCHITSDHKYAPVSETFLNASGDVAKDDIVISTEIIRVPVLVNDEIEVEGVTEDGALLSWVEATDDSTPQSELVYTLYTMRRYGDTDYSFYKDGKNFTSCKLYNLKPNTEYYAMVRVEDKDGNLTFYKETSFTTLPESDKTAPTLSNSAINVTDVTDNSVSISWDKASDDSTAQDNLYYTAGYSGPEEHGDSPIKRFVSKAPMTTNAVSYGNDMTSCTIDNLEPETSYDFYVAVYDKASNGTTYTKKTVVTKALPDVTAPSLGEITISVDDLTRTSITLSWNLATDDRTPQDKLVYSVEYRKAGESAWITRNAGNTNIHTIDGLTEDTDYEVSIKVADEAGNETSYGGFTITTLPDPATAITTATADGNNGSRTYSTSGIRVDKNFRGIVIKDGKKVMVK